jgi:hypothetical protein
MHKGVNTVSKDNTIESLLHLIELQNHILRNHPPTGYNAALMSILMMSGRLVEMRIKLEEYIELMPLPVKGDEPDGRED